MSTWIDGLELARMTPRPLFGPLSGGWESGLKWAAWTGEEFIGANVEFTPEYMAAQDELNRCMSAICALLGERYRNGDAVIPSVRMTIHPEQK